MMRDLETHTNPNEEVVCDCFVQIFQHARVFEGVPRCAQPIKCRPLIQGEFRVGGVVHVCLPDNFMQSEYLLSAVHLCSKCESELQFLFPPSLIVI